MVWNLIFSKFKIEGKGLSINILYISQTMFIELLKRYSFIELLIYTEHLWT